MAEKKDQSVLGNLPSTRPARMGRRREAHEAEAGGDQAERRRSRRPRPPPRSRAAAKVTKPRPVRSGSPSLERPKRPAPPPPKPSSSPPKGAELVTTTVQAVGELAQIGLTLGGQVAKRALKRLPKP